MGVIIMNVSSECSMNDIRAGFTADQTREVITLPGLISNVEVTTKVKIPEKYLLERFK